MTKAGGVKAISYVWMYLASLIVGMMILSAAACNTQPAARDTAAAEAAIRKADADWVKAAQSKKAEDWVAFYSEDAVVLPPNDKTMTGKEAVRQPIADMLATPGLVLTWEPTRVEIAKSGDGPRQDGRNLEEAGRRLLEMHRRYVELGLAANATRSPCGERVRVQRCSTDVRTKVRAGHEENTFRARLRSWPDHKNVE